MITRKRQKKLFGQILIFGKIVSLRGFTPKQSFTTYKIAFPACRQTDYIHNDGGFHFVCNDNFINSKLSFTIFTKSVIIKFLTYLVSFFSANLKMN